LLLRGLRVLLPLAPAALALLLRASAWVAFATAALITAAAAAATTPAALRRALPIRFPRRALARLLAPLVAARLSGSLVHFFGLRSGRTS